MNAIGLAVVVHVSDLDKASSYYSNMLGFDIDFRFGDYLGLIRNDVCIHLSGPNNLGVKKAPGGAHFYIECLDVEVYYDLITKRGAIVNVPIDNRTYGMRDFAVDDPDGNTLVFGMPTA